MVIVNVVHKLIIGAFSVKCFGESWLWRILIYFNPFSDPFPLQYKDHLFRHRDSHYKKRWLWPHLVFIIGISSLIRWHLYIELGPFIYWNRNIFFFMKFSTLPWLEIVILISTEAASDENFIKMTTFLFWWYNAVHLMNMDTILLCFVSFWLHHLALL